ncbi:MAG: sulfurtransferase [Rhodothermales bacterium]|nr:sulfurtransferase [Rhodothermales bacterium]
MPHTTLVSPETLRPYLADPDWAVVDCRFALGDPDRGRHAYREAHLPGAVYAHLDADLSGPIVPGTTGRHPLPDPATLAATLGGWGIGPGVQVVAYDDAGGAFAARLWWMLHWLGHPPAAVLDGGFPAWKRAGYPVRAGEEQRPARVFTPRPDPRRVADADAVDALRTDASCRLLDARAAERYRGAHEPIDPVAGHIPGAVNAPWAANLDDDGRFLPPKQLRRRFEKLLGGVPPARAAVYCGSGVTAAHDLLAMAHAGLGGARLYPGSWSHWITDPARPVARDDGARRS